MWGTPRDGARESDDEICPMPDRRAPRSARVLLNA